MPLPGGFAEQLQKCLPAGRLLFDAESCAPFEADGLTMFRRRPAAVALPDNEEEVVQIINCCRRAAVPLITRGAGTGLSGGALPSENGVLLVMARMNRILEINPQARTARVQSGARNLAVSEAARPHNLFYAPDPSSQQACSIGGNVCENSGGVRCLKYGLTVHCVAAVRAITANGEAVDIAADAPGLDFLALLHGSEGLLAVITEITLRLSPLPEAAHTVLAGFDSPAAAGDAVAAVIAGGVIPAGLEMMDELAARAAENFAAAGYPNCPALLIAETDGRREDAERDLERLCQILSECGANPLRRAKDAAERALFWKGRKSAFPAVGTVAPDYYCMDGTIPRKHLGRVLTEIAALSKKHGLLCANVFHAGDGNLHPLILFDGNAPGEAETAQRFGSDIMKLCLDAGGTITGEHGVGVEKIDEMCAQFAPDELQIFHGIKRAFDGEGFLNPGKAVPTLNRCAEFGMMHVRRGAEKFSELPRF